MNKSSYAQYTSPEKEALYLDNDVIEYVKGSSNHAKEKIRPTPLY